MTESICMTMTVDSQGLVAYPRVYTNWGKYLFTPEVLFVLLKPDNMSKTYMAQLPIHLSLSLNLHLPYLW